MKWYIILVYTRRVNSAFHARWLTGSELIKKHYSPPRSQRDNIAYHNSITRKKKKNIYIYIYIGIGFWVVSIKMIIHFSVGKSVGYLSRRSAA